MVNENFLVSVLMITYNHEKYITQAIDSVLMQKTNFDFEIVIGEDCSTDGTREIVLKYKKKYPNKIKLLLHETNQGANKNLIDTYRLCEGKYIALLEGDDFWTKSDKLQVQVEFLENNQDFSFCFHNAYVLDEETKKQYLFNDSDTFLLKKNLSESRKVQAWELLNEWICPTASVVFRNNNNLNLELLNQTKYGDIVLFLSLSRFGQIFYLDNICSVYRKLNNGQRKVYSKNLPGLISHQKLIMENFSDIEYIDFVCSKFLSVSTYYNLITDLYLNGLKNFKTNFKSFKYYLNKTIMLKAPNNKLRALIFIFYKTLKYTLKYLIRYNI